MSVECISLNSACYRAANIETGRFVIAPEILGCGYVHFSVHTHFELIMNLFL